MRTRPSILSWIRDCTKPIRRTTIHQLLLLVLFGYLVFRWTRSQYVVDSANDIHKAILTGDTPKTILIYDTLQNSYEHWMMWWKLKKDQRCFEREKNLTYRCRVIFGNESVSDADLVVFSWGLWDRVASSPVPAKRDGQVWALVTREAPLLRSDVALPVDWIVTYESDSDVEVPYGQIAERKEALKDSIRFPSKRRLAAALISHCNASSKRDELIRDLKNENLTIHVYGKCGIREIPGKFIRGYNYLSRKYKFLLSFENAICKHYVTEKFYQALQFPWIPVVLGGANYSSIAPPKSYVDVMDFSSVRNLAEYLRYLDGNDTAYCEYFSWKSDYVVEFETNRGCKLCKRLHESGNTRVVDLRDFSKERRCFFPDSVERLFSWHRFS